MKEDVDSGDILSQRTIKISIQDNARSLYNKIATEALKQLEEIILAAQDAFFNSEKPLMEDTIYDILHNEKLANNLIESFK